MMVCICPADMEDNYSQLCDAEAAGLLAVYDLLPYTDLPPDRDFVELKLRLQMFAYEMLWFHLVSFHILCLFNFLFFFSSIIFLLCVFICL